jgi:3',5'-nucleoside bisphosphate phosphatase
MKVDLHMHSTASDGKLSPEELVDWAIKKELSVIAVTDHEVVDGSRKAIEYAKDKGVEVISGIEIGADDEKIDVYDVHIVGLFLDLENKALLELSEKLMKARAVQKKEMICLLNELGYEITFEELKKESGGINYGRPHIARVLMRKYDEFESMGDVFDKLLGYRCVADVRQWKDSMKNTIDIIHSAGGVAVLAHPMLYSDAENIVDRFFECGGDSIEVDYFYENRKISVGEAGEKVKRAGEIAKEKGFVVSGGGDFHSDVDPHEIGDYGVSLEEFGKLRKYWGEKWGK